MQAAQRSLPCLGDVDLQPGAERGQPGLEEARLAVELAHCPALVGDLLHLQDLEARDLGVLYGEGDDVGRHGDQYGAKARHHWGGIGRSWPLIVHMTVRTPRWSGSDRLQVTQAETG